MYYDILDCIIAGLSSRFNAVRDIHKLFNFLWNFKSMIEIELCHQATAFDVRYSADVSSDKLVEEMKHLKAIYDTNFGSNPIEPIMLLNKISQFHLDDVFSNVAVALRIFCTIPVTVASAERSFRKLAQIQNFLRSTMLQTRF